MGTWLTATVLVKCEVMRTGLVRLKKRDDELSNNYNYNNNIVIPLTCTNFILHSPEQFVLMYERS